VLARPKGIRANCIPDVSHLMYHVLHPRKSTALVSRARPITLILHLDASLIFFPPESSRGSRCEIPAAVILAAIPRLSNGERLKSSRRNSSFEFRRKPTRDPRRGSLRASLARPRSSSSTNSAPFFHLFLDSLDPYFFLPDPAINGRRLARQRRTAHMVRRSCS